MFDKLIKFLGEKHSHPLMAEEKEGRTLSCSTRDSRTTK